MRRLIAVAAFSLVGCATTPKPPPTQTAEKAQTEAAPKAKPQGVDLKAMSERELATPLGLRPVTMAGGAFSAQVEAAGDPKVAEDEGFTSVSVPLGLGDELGCFVYPREIDAASALQAIINSIAQSQTTQLRQVRPVNVVAVGTDPLMFVEALYVAQTPNGNALGMLKLGVHTTSDVSAVCVHDDVGYWQTFQRMVGTFARTLKAQTPSDEAVRFAELFVVRLGEVPVGFERRRVLEAEGGGRVDQTVEAVFLPRSPTEVTVEDTSSVTVTDRAGRISTISVASAQNGELELEINVERTKGNSYAYEGNRSGKKVSGEFKSKDKAGLPGDPIFEAFVKGKLFDGKTAEYKLEQYEPEIDFTRPVEITIKPRSDAPRGLSMQVATLTMRGTAAEDGTLNHVELDVGPAKFVQERIAQEGKL